MTKFVYVLLLIFVMTFLTQFDYGGGEGSLKVKECPSACSNRCSKTKSRKRFMHYCFRCMHYCYICCEECLCSLWNLWQQQARMSLLQQFQTRVSLIFIHK
ncbi:hypothetical protein VIGAN_04435600 [Vigna angularis var. angularis]|uniref:Uncharacterized protein n=1 Tax=Vigna angularis var. angularis TaxID=157739 RepID=A0A0S3S1F3_PHAAN|nr:hypothetical protein VIGAN_04435600 [Vigna angularis var. angularis]